MQPDLSVVVPARDVEAYLPDMLTAIELNTTRDDPRTEVIVVDDGSTDATPEVVAEFSERLDLTVVRHDVATGLADARNAGLELATGRYVTFLDGDDWIAPGYLRSLVDAADMLGCDFVRVDHVQAKGRDRSYHLAPEARRGIVLDPASGILPASRRTMVDYPYAWAGVYRRDLGELLRFPAGLHTAEDRPWIWRLHTEAASYAVVTLAGLFYRRLVTNSLTQIGDARQLHFLNAYAMVLRDTGSGVAADPRHFVKAVRQFLGVLAHQHELAEARFTPDLIAELDDRARFMLAEIDPDVIARALPSDDRVARLAPLLPYRHRVLDGLAS